MITILRYHFRRAIQTITGQPKTVCAWCQRESGQQPEAGQSHGICPAHRAAMLAEIRNLKPIAA